MTLMSSGFGGFGLYTEIKRTSACIYMYLVNGQAQVPLRFSSQSGQTCYYRYCYLHLHQQEFILCILTDIDKPESKSQDQTKVK